MRLVALALLALAFAGCALVEGKGPVANPDPKEFPCGPGVECKDTNPHTCCPVTMACATDDGGPYCASDEGYDPSDPTTWAAKKPKRSPRTQLLR